MDKKSLLLRNTKKKNKRIREKNEKDIYRRRKTEASQQRGVITKNGVKGLKTHEMRDETHEKKIGEEEKQKHAELTYVRCLQIFR